MATYFFDTSALAKRYVNESGTPFVRALCDASTGNDVFICQITELEMTAAVVRRVAGGMLSAADATKLLSQFRIHLGNEYQVLDITDSLIADAVSLIERHGLRSNDGLQLGSALQLAFHCSKRRLTTPILASSDSELNSAAQSEGLVVDDPNLHP